MNDPSRRPVCPYAERFRPSGRDHVYDLCHATGEGLLVPSQSELADLCHGDFATCERFRATRFREHLESVESDRTAA